MRKIVTIISTVLIGMFLLIAGSPQGTAQTATPFVIYSCASQGSAGLQAAENSVPSGGTLYVSGTCSTGLTVNPDTTLTGNNAGTIFNGPVVYTSPTGTVTISDIEVMCGSAPACVNIEGGWRVNVTGVITYGGTYGIEVSAPPCPKGSGCNVNDYFSHDFIKGNPLSYGFYVNDPANTITDGFFTDSWVDGGTDSIHLGNAAGWAILNDHVYAETGLAVYANRLYGSEISGVYAEAGGMNLIVQKNSQPSVIEGNRIRAGGITLSSVGPGCSVAVYGNVTATGIVNQSACIVTEAANLP